MARKKRERIAETKAMPNILEYPNEIPEHWDSYFGWHASQVLELGCGKGEYTVTLGRHHPDYQFIGVDVKGDRLWVGARQALDEGLGNVAFLRTPAEKLTDLFSKNNIQSIWLTFPDPFPKPSKAKRRMISGRFLDIYEQILQPGGRLHLKTDFAAYFEFGLETVESRSNWICQAYTWDLYNSSLLDEVNGIQTYYENLARREGNTIKYGVFEFRPD